MTHDVVLLPSRAERWTRQPATLTSSFPVEEMTSTPIAPQQAGEGVGRPVGLHTAAVSMAIALRYLTARDGRFTAGP